MGGFSFSFSSSSSSSSTAGTTGGFRPNIPHPPVSYCYCLLPRALQRRG